MTKERCFVKRVLWEYIRYPIAVVDSICDMIGWMLEDAAGFATVCILASMPVDMILISRITNGYGLDAIFVFAFAISLLFIPLYKAFYECYVED